MYIPKFNLATDRDEIVSFMQRFSFATIISSKNDIPVATHLPFIVTIRDDQVVLTSHFAKANEQWKDLEGNKPLVIFSEPHAYISTSNYDKELNVPTWNYISVHAYGKAQLLTEPAEAMKVINSTIEAFEQSYGKQWDSFPDEYKSKMLHGIVAFEVVVDDLQGKKKLSQNRSESEKDKIIQALSHSNDMNEKVIASYMLSDKSK
ncbi:FMN-binding negative transcriptional regulator [Daejeonella lutea]|uniref:Negative transcriptional regulator, PaiB family n=1 Tax=Daejeonella lutea TaxID=572036 RepID=A0A1T5A9H7_9SPHI|nr:FMN-binding negative transcriptional regulator [Daejeonella lutea]SKB31519.1 negative transcriptional regulator, PaiB family [Daejeonella lutea]